MSEELNTYTVSIFRVGQVSIAPLRRFNHKRWRGVGTGATELAREALKEANLGDGDYLVTVHFKSCDETRLLTATIRKPVVSSEIILTNGGWKY